MKTNTRPTLLSAILLGGLLFTPGCSTPTVTVGAPTRSDRFVLHVSSTTPTQVQCVWLQDGAAIEHSGPTPFRLVLPDSTVHTITLLKAAEAADVVVLSRSPGAKATRFVMDRGSTGMKLVRQNHRWEGRIF